MYIKYSHTFLHMYISKIFCAGPSGDCPSLCLRHCCPGFAQFCVSLIIVHPEYLSMLKEVEDCSLGRSAVSAAFSCIDTLVAIL